MALTSSPLNNLNRYQTSLHVEVLKSLSIEFFLDMDKGPFGQKYW